MTERNLGLILSPILSEIEHTLWQHQCQENGLLLFTHEGFRAAIKIFMDVMLAKTWELQENENLDQIDRCNMAEKLGNDLRSLIKTYTNIDTHELYNEIKS